MNGPEDTAVGPSPGCPSCRGRVCGLNEGAESGICPVCGTSTALAGPERVVGGSLDVPGEFAIPAEYRVIAKLGEGGMGAVFKARHVSLDRLVALKVLVLPNKEMRGRFLREGRILSRLKHPNIMEVYSLEEGGAHPLLVCEYLEGETLKALITREGILPPGRARKLFCLMAEGVSYAHQQGVVHRDLKTENVLILPSGDVKLLDFGLAKHSDVQVIKTKSGMIMGTPAYMAPEQAQNMKVDHRADIYSMGIILFEMLTGRLPFKHPNAIQNLLMHQTTPPPLVNEVAPHVTPALSRIVSKCLAKAPSDRFQSAPELLVALAGPAVLEASPPGRAAGTLGLSAGSHVSLEITLDAGPATQTVVAAGERTRSRPSGRTVVQHKVSAEQSRRWPFRLVVAAAVALGLVMVMAVTSTLTRPERGTGITESSASLEHAGPGPSKEAGNEPARPPRGQVAWHRTLAKLATSPETVSPTELEDVLSSLEDPLVAPVTRELAAEIVTATLGDRAVDLLLALLPEAEIGLQRRIQSLLVTRPEAALPACIRQLDFLEQELHADLIQARMEDSASTLELDHTDCIGRVLAELRVKPQQWQNLVGRLRSPRLRNSFGALYALAVQYAHLRIQGEIPALPVDDLQQSLKKILESGTEGKPLLYDRQMMVVLGWMLGESRTAGSISLLSQLTRVPSLEWLGIEALAKLDPGEVDWHQIIEGLGARSAEPIPPYSFRSLMAIFSRIEDPQSRAMALRITERAARPGKRQSLPPYLSPEEPSSGRPRLPFQPLSPERGTHWRLVLSHHLWRPEGITADLWGDERTGLDTGIDLEPGMSVQVEASGFTRWDRRRRDYWSATGEGEMSDKTHPQSPIWIHRALYGWIGVTTQPWQIGLGGRWKVNLGGRLFLGLCDPWDRGEPQKGFLLVRIVALPETSGQTVALAVEPSKTPMKVPEEGSESRFSSKVWDTRLEETLSRVSRRGNPKWPPERSLPLSAPERARLGKFVNLVKTRLKADLNGRLWESWTRPAGIVSTVPFDSRPTALQLDLAAQMEGQLSPLVEWLEAGGRFLMRRALDDDTLAWPQRHSVLKAVERMLAFDHQAILARVPLQLGATDCVGTRLGPRSGPSGKTDKVLVDKSPDLHVCQEIKVKDSDELAVLQDVFTGNVEQVRHWDHTIDIKEDLLGEILELMIQGRVMPPELSILVSFKTGGRQKTFTLIGPEFLSEISTLRLRLPASVLGPGKHQLIVQVADVEGVVGKNNALVVSRVRVATLK